MVCTVYNFSDWNIWSNSDLEKIEIYLKVFGLSFIMIALHN